MGHFRITRLGRNRERDLCDDLAVIKRSCEQALEEILGCNAPLVGLDRCAECKHRRRIVRGRIVVGDRPADGTAIAHGRIADQRGEISERRDRFLRRSARGHVVVRCRRLDGHRVGGNVDADEFLDPSEIDHVGRRGKPLLHDRDQRVTAGKILCLRTLREKRRGFVNGGGAMVGCLIHGAAPCSFPFGPPRHSGMRACAQTRNLEV